MREVCPGERRALPPPPSHGGIVRPQMSHEPNMPSGMASDLDPAQHQEPRREQRHRAPADAQSARDVGRVRLREAAHGEERKGERGQSEDEIAHQAPAAPLLSCSSSRRAPAPSLLPLSASSALRPPAA